MEINLSFRVLRVHCCLACIAEDMFVWFSQNHQKLLTGWATFSLFMSLPAIPMLHSSSYHPILMPVPPLPPPPLTHPHPHPHPHF